ncbi:GNAT family N-acetyltransferase [Sphingopyxis sp.]|jgi:RimJ/RimL family protein N-acetyltransferase|uniref:GNAT family N-acetyltransferase n=1 Tax=Sphingopyxis sp. TaxID=1908224 RepID=UPI002DEB8658|nr:GNAT family N-acetyltransferase [Sphingopyxis sp.]
MTDSNRVSLRLMTEDDITEEYVSWFRDATVTEYLDSRGFSVQDARDYLRQGFETRAYFMYAVIDNESGLHIGNVKLGPISWMHGTADLVTVIGRREFWGKGLATEAIKAGNQIAFKEYGIRKLSGGIADGNEGSVKAYTRGGWVIEGRLKGHHMIDGTPRDRIVVSCFNPDFFPDA